MLFSTGAPAAKLFIKNESRNTIVVYYLYQSSVGGGLGEEKNYVFGTDLVMAGRTGLSIDDYIPNPFGWPSRFGTVWLGIYEFGSRGWWNPSYRDSFVINSSNTSLIFRPQIGEYQIKLPNKIVDKYFTTYDNYYTVYNKYLRQGFRKGKSFRFFKTDIYGEEYTWTVY